MNTKSSRRFVLMQGATALTALLAPTVLIGESAARSPASVYPPWASELQRRLDALREETGAPGMAAAVEIPGRQLFEFQSGLADRESGRALRRHDRFLIASIGKTIVAATAIALAQRGVLSLDDLASRWLGERPWFDRPANSRAVTLRMLLNHSSGIANHAASPIFLDWLKSAGRRVVVTPTPEQLIAYVLDEPPAFQPGEGFQYSDTNYLLAGLVMEQASGRSFYRLAHDLVLRPLRLTAIIPSASRRIRRLVPGYLAPQNDFDWPERVTAANGDLIFDPLLEWTGGGFASSAGDLTRWIAALGAGYALPQPYLDQLLASAMPSEAGAAFRYGLGVAIAQTDLGVFYGHGSDIPGYSGIAAYFPERDVAVTILANKYDAEFSHSDWLVRIGGAAMGVPVSAR